MGGNLLREEALFFYLRPGLCDGERARRFFFSLSQLWAAKVRLSRRVFFAIDKLSERAIGIVYPNRH